MFETESHYVASCTGTQSVDLAGLKFTKILLPLFAHLWNGCCDSAPWLLLEMINLKLPWHVACAKNMPRCRVEASLDEIYNEVRRETSVAGCESMGRDWQCEGRIQMLGWGE